MPVDVTIVREAMEELGGEQLLDFVPSEYALHAQHVYDQLGSPEMKGIEMWKIFRMMLPQM